MSVLMDHFNMPIQKVLLCAYRKIQQTLSKGILFFMFIKYAQQHPWSMVLIF